MECYKLRKRKQRKTLQMVDSYIVCLHKVVTVGYNVLQGYDKGHVTDSLTAIYLFARM